MLAELDPDTTTWLGPVTSFVEASMFSGRGISYTRKGLAFVDSWGSLRNAASMAHIAMRAASVVDQRADAYIGFDRSSFQRSIVWAQYARCFARQQMNYIYGDAGRSFITGWGTAPPKRPHHRGAACSFVITGESCDGDTFLDPNRVFPNQLIAGLQGGPDQTDSFTDSQLNYVQSEVAVDYNAALITGTAGVMTMPDWFWANVGYCERYPVAAINFNKVNYL